VARSRPWDGYDDPSGGMMEEFADVYAQSALHYGDRGWPASMTLLLGHIKSTGAVLTVCRYIGSRRNQIGTAPAL
jgi:hypothetical protein